MNFRQHVKKKGTLEEFSQCQFTHIDGFLQFRGSPRSFGTFGVPVFVQLKLFKKYYTSNRP